MKRKRGLDIPSSLIDNSLGMASKQFKTELNQIAIDTFLNEGCLLAKDTLNHFILPFGEE